MVYLEAAPTALANIGWKYYLLFIMLTVLDIAVVWFLFLETKGLSLEEIGARFGDEVVIYLTGLTEERPVLDRRILDEKGVEREKGGSGESS